MKNTLKLLIISLLIIAPITSLRAETLPNRLKGKILLQVEDKGQAWYVEPKTGARYYMANGDEAYNIMRNLGVGVTNKDLEKIQNNKNLAVKHSGKIFLQVESKGEAYYVDFSGNLHYLKNGSEAYGVMRNLGLGITNKDLDKINISNNSNQPSNDKEVIVKGIEYGENKKSLDVESANSKINETISSINKVISSFQKTKNENEIFIKSTQDKIKDYLYSDLVQSSGQELINEVQNENFLIDKQIDILNKIIVELNNIYNTGETVSDTSNNLVSQLSNYSSQYKISQEKSKNLIKTHVANIEDALKAELARKQAVLAQKQAEIDQMKVECNNPINEMRQQIIQLKTDYYKKVADINNKPISMNSINGQIARLTDDTNAQINVINNNIEQKQLECSTKYGN